MSTRATIKIKQSFYNTDEDYDKGILTPYEIKLYHHSDGYPEGIGADIVEFLRNRNDGYDTDNPIWEAERIATDMVRGEVLSSKSCSKPKDVHRDMGYDVAICQHGDCVYGYLIDCDERKVTCYDIEPGQEDWTDDCIVEIPDTWAQFGGLHLPEEVSGMERFNNATEVEKAKWLLETAEECKVKHPDLEWDDIISRAKEKLAEAKGEK